MPLLGLKVMVGRTLITGFNDECSSSPRSYHVQKEEGNCGRFISYCPIALGLRLFGEAALCWVIPAASLLSFLKGTLLLGWKEG